MDSRKTIVVLFLILPFLSGCVVPSLPFFDGSPFDSNTQSGSGVVIEHFGPDNSRVYTGEEVEFRLKVKNTGSVRVDNGFAELLGIDQVWVGGSGTESGGDREVFPVEQRCRYTSKGIKLLPPDPDTGTRGGEETCTWRYVAPEVKTGLETTYNPKVRFFYDYHSSTVESVTLVPKEDMVNIQNKGESLPAETVSRSSSPISIEVKTSSPIRMYQEKVDFPVVITVKNIGGGTVCSDIEHCKKAWTENVWAEKEGWYKLNINIDVADMEINCGKETGGQELITLVGASPQTISCKVSAAKPETGFVQKNIKVTADYGYFIDKTTSVVVLPSPVLE